jgi:YVTN family beta-propeller protein
MSKMKSQKKFWLWVILGLLVMSASITIIGCGGGGGSDSGSSGPAFSIVTNPADNVTQTSATLNGTVNPNGVSTVVYFQYGKTTSYSSTVGYQNIGSGASSINVSVNLTGLSPRTLYNFRIRATRGNTTFNGANRTFTTESAPPICTTNPATNIIYDSARLNGTVNPNGAATNTYFEYGITSTPPSYTITTTAYAIGSGSNNVPVYVDITGLSSNTEYNFMVFGINSTGTSYGNNLTFITAAPLGSPPTCITDPASNVITNSATLNGTVIPNGVDTDAYFEYGITTIPITYPISTTLQPIGNGITSVALSATVSSLTPNTLYNFRIVGTNGPLTTTYGNNLTFTTLVTPTCTTNAATNVTCNSATLNGTVNPNGLNVISCYFDYGTSTSYGISATVISLPGSGTSPISVTANVFSLSPITHYNFRVVATNAGGTNNGLNQTFNTTALLRPTCTTNDATNITDTSATLNGTVNPNGLDVTSCYFDYGTSISYGRQQSVDSLPGSGTSPIPVTVNVSSLSISTTYNFRVVATNSVGKTNGSNQTFTTTAPAVDAYCWVANSYSGTITRITKSNSATNTFAATGMPGDLAVDGTHIWVAHGNYNNVTRIKKLDLTTTAIAVGTTSGGIAVDETYCWVTHYYTNNVTRILKSNLAITTTIAVGTGPSGVAVDGTYCWVTNEVSNTVTRILKSNPAITTTIALGNIPRGVAVDETYCWVTNYASNNVTRILKSNPAISTTITVGANPCGVAVDGTYCWVANSAITAGNGGNTVTRIQKSNLSTTTITVGNAPVGVAVDGTYCWVANAYSDTVTRILKADSTKTNIAVGSYPYSTGDMTGFAYDNYSWVP